MSEPTLDEVIDATTYVAPPERHGFIRDTLTRLWPHDFVQWYVFLMNVGHGLHLASDKRLMFNIVLDGFTDGSTRGMVGLALFIDEQPLSRLMLALQGDFDGGLENADQVSVTVAQVAADQTLVKVAGARLDPVESLTFGQIGEIAQRALEMLDRAEPEPEKRPWWCRWWGEPTGIGSLN